MINSYTVMMMRFDGFGPALTKEEIEDLWTAGLIEIDKENSVYGMTGTGTKKTRSIIKPVYKATPEGERLRNF